MARRRNGKADVPLGLAGTVAVHGLAIALLAASAQGARAFEPPTYRVHLVAAPDLPPATKAPPAVEREAAPPPAPEVATKRAVPKPAPKPAPPPADQKRREEAPRVATPNRPLPGETPSTGTDVATVSTEGIEFPYPEYLNNIVSQVLRRWQRPQQSTPLDAEVSFFVHRDGSITDLQFVKRSGNFAFDLEAEGAVEEAGRTRAFGVLPAAWPGNVLFVRFFFSGVRQ